MTKEERQLFEELRNEVKKFKSEQSIYCDTDWLIEIAEHLFDQIDMFEDTKEARELAYEIISKDHNVSINGLREIYGICSKSGDTSRLRDVKLLKEDIENRPERLCPFMKEQILIHNDKKNYMMPEHGINKRMDYDLYKDGFSPCIRKKCMMYDEATGTCKRH